MQSTRARIEWCLATASEPLTYNQLAELTNRSVSTVAYHVKQLRRQGSVKRSRRHRSLRLTESRHPRVAKELCATVVEQLAAAQTMEQAVACYDSLVELLEMLEAIAA